jgi:hypothetical protein
VAVAIFPYKIILFTGVTINYLLLISGGTTKKVPPEGYLF